MTKAFVRNIADAPWAAPARHLSAHAWALVTPALGGSPNMTFFSVCEIRFGGAAILDNHKNADHCYFILSGRGYSLINGKRYEYKPGDVMWIPGNSDHEMYPIGVETLRFVVTLTTGTDAVPFRQTEPFIRNVKDVTPGCPPLHENASSWPLALPTTGGGDTIEFYVTEIRPGGSALKDVHQNEDHVYFFLSGRGYSIIEGERFEFGPADALFIPKGSQHEMYVEGEATLRFVVTFSPARVK